MLEKCVWRDKDGRSKLPESGLGLTAQIQACKTCTDVPKKHDPVSCARKAFIELTKAFIVIMCYTYASTNRNSAAITIKCVKGRFLMFYSSSLIIFCISEITTPAMSCSEFFLCLNITLGLLNLNTLLSTLLPCSAPLWKKHIRWISKWSRGASLTLKSFKEAAHSVKSFLVPEKRAGGVNFMG